MLPDGELKGVNSVTVVVCSGSCPMTSGVAVVAAGIRVAVTGSAAAAISRALRCFMDACYDRTRHVIRESASRAWVQKIPGIPRARS